MQLFELSWAQVTKRRMAAAHVVERLDIVKDVQSGLVM
jgi:hypothetical protein